MTRVTPTTTCILIHHDDRFSFSCERRRRTVAATGPFGILFHHPLCLDAERLDSLAATLGSDTYIAPTRRCARNEVVSHNMFACRRFLVRMLSVSRQPLPHDRTSPRPAMEM